MIAPLLTIVIPVLNQARYIRDCLDSLAAQSGPDIEILIRDAGSTDGTLDIIGEYGALIDDVYSGKDRGQSDALDAGFRRARGEYLTWLNADDVLLPGAISSIREHLRGDGPRPKWLVGDTVLIDENGRVTRASRAGRCLAGRWLRQAHTYSPSSVFLKEIYDEVGGLDLSFHYMMDTDLWYRFLRAGHRYERAKEHWWGFREHVGSKTTAHKFSEKPSDPYSPTEYRKHAEQQELFLRHSVASGGYLELASDSWARALRCLELSLPLQILDSQFNCGRPWPEFRRFGGRRR